MYRKLLPILTAAITALAPAARGVVVAIDNSASYTQAPTPTVNNFGFGNIAIVSNYIAGIPASGVYLGNGWILTAYHNLNDGGSGFQIGGISLQGINYSGDSSTFTRLRNPDTTFTDLAMFRLTTVPSGVPTLTLSGATPTAGMSVSMMGNGVDRELTETHWDSSWQEVGTTGANNGYKLTGTRTLRWGTNTLASGLVNVGDSFGNFQGFYTTFDATSGDAQATSGDSGGGVFRKVGSNWELMGIMLGNDSLSGQPAGTVAYGNHTFAANISTYKTQIESTMALPEPSAALFSLAGIAISSQRRRRAKGVPSS